MPYADSDGVRICWEDAGQGEPVLLIMGHMYPRQMWHWLLPALTERFHVIWFDNRGAGDSDKPRGPYTVEQMAADALAVLEAAGESGAHVIGVSMGGLMAQELALAHRDRVRSLVLGCTGALPPHKAVSPGVRDRLVAHLHARAPRRLRVRLNARVVYGPTTAPEKIARDLSILRAQRYSAAGLLGQAAAVGAYHSLDRLASLSLPTLVLHGDQDRVVPLEMGRQLAATIPRARLVVLQGAGHNFVADCTEEATGAILSFLEEAEAAR